MKKKTPSPSSTLMRMHDVYTVHCTNAPQFMRVIIRSLNVSFWLILCTAHCKLTMFCVRKCGIDDVIELSAQRHYSMPSTCMMPIVSLLFKLFFSFFIFIFHPLSIKWLTVNEQVHFHNCCDLTMRRSSLNGIHNNQ